MEQVMDKIKQMDGETTRNLVLGAGIDKNPALQQQLREKFNYDINNPPLLMDFYQYLAMAEFLRQNLYPLKTEDDGYEALGRCTVQGHFQGAVGRVNKVAARMLGPERGAELFVRVNANALPFGRHELEEVRKGYIRYHAWDVPGPPALTRGIIYASLETGGAKNIKVTSTVFGPDEVVFEVTWS